MVIECPVYVRPPIRQVTYHEVRGFQTLVLEVNGGQVRLHDFFPFLQST